MAHRVLGVTSAIALVLTLGACNGDGDGVAVTDEPSRATTTVPTPGDTSLPDRAGECSAAGLAGDLEAQAGLPHPVAEMRSRIAAAAAACNYQELEQLAQAGPGDFTYSFGGGDQPAEYWRQLEESGDGAPLRFMVEILKLPYGTVEVQGQTQYVWPSAFAYDSWDAVPPEEVDALRRLLGDEELQGFAQFGAYVGYRHGITADGNWIFFVRGD